MLNEISFRIKPYLWGSKFDIPIQVRNYGWLMFGFAVFSTGIPPGGCGIAGSHAQLRWRELVSIPSSSRPLREGPPRPLKAPWCYGHAVHNFMVPKQLDTPCRLASDWPTKEMRWSIWIQMIWPERIGLQVEARVAQKCNSATHVYRKPRETPLALFVIGLRTIWRC